MTLDSTAAAPHPSPRAWAHVLAALDAIVEIQRLARHGEREARARKVE
ncbi:MAG TPA: hypothetical protein VKB80_14940 [Kofleriaceae bacterium]|nr:hypothetical protein [Kofleriaceae bacterium]